MAAPGRHVGHYIHRNGRFLLSNVDQLLGHRSFGWTSALRQQATEASKESTDSIVIPRKKTWSKEAVLEALSLTVSRDPTAHPYHFQDDAFLSPRNSLEFRMFSLSQESGRSAAKFFVNNNPKFFTKDFAEPHIPCLMPEPVSVCLEEVSEEALKERINLQEVQASVDMYDQLLQAGKAVSMETTHNLLDLICLYCDREPPQEGEPQAEDMVSKEEVKRMKARDLRLSDITKFTWKNNNNAERIFNLLPERDTRCYSALIRGMVKYGAYAKAFSMYTDMLNNRVTGDVHIFNALISAAPSFRETYNEKWDLILELLKQMNEQNIRPNLLTFNSLLKALKHCGFKGKMQALSTLNEMKALGIAPSLATYTYILEIFYRGASFDNQSPDLFSEVLAELEGAHFTCRDPYDVRFFCFAIKLCLNGKDLELAYKVHNLIEFGENWKLAGDANLRSIYYRRFLSLVCMMEHADIVLKWYRQIVPSRFYPSPMTMRDIVQAVDTDSRLDLLPMIWKDMKRFGLENKADLVDEVLRLMARETHSPEVQESFAVCALDIKSLGNEKPNQEWSAAALSDITTLLLRANKIKKAWEMLPLFKSNNRAPSQQLLDDFLTACHGDGAAQKAVELVQLSAVFCLPTTPQLAKRTLDEFDLTGEQRAIISDLEMTGESSD